MTVKGKEALGGPSSPLLPDLFSQYLPRQPIVRSSQVSPECGSHRRLPHASLATFKFLAGEMCLRGRECGPGTSGRLAGSIGVPLVEVFAVSCDPTRLPPMPMPTLAL